MIMVVIGKHKEILIDLLIHYLANTNVNNEFIIDYIKERNSDGKWYISYYIDQWGELPWTATQQSRTHQRGKQR